MLDLVIISGASKGIGKSIANSSFKECKNLIAISSSDQIFKIKNDKCNVLNLKLNLLDYNNVSIELEKVLNNLKDIKTIGIVLCAAQLGDFGGILNTDLNMWQDIFNINVLGNLSVIKSVISKFGDIQYRIVCFAGGGAAFSNPEFSAYSLSKISIVKAVENIAIEVKDKYNNFSIIALSPGAVNTDMLKTVISKGGFVRTRTDISEPTKFVIKFITDKIPNIDHKKLSGMFLHVRDHIYDEDISYDDKDIFKLRRVQ